MTTTPLSALELQWTERVAAWRASGQGVAEFAHGKGFAASTLTNWAGRLRRTGRRKFVPVVRKARTVSPPAELLIEVGAARVRVAVGFDAALLADVVCALGAAAEGAR